MATTPLSVYILTHNSPKYFAQILAQAKHIADEILIIDSGSSDNTLAIAQQFDSKILHKPFENFREQRAYALQQCKYDWVLAFDSDEVPSDELITAIHQLKQNGFMHDAYGIRRNWNVLGKNVHAMFPVTSPDYPIRLLNKKTVLFDERSTRNHETAHGYESLGKIESPLFHFTFETQEILEDKLRHYAQMSAEDLIEKRRSLSVMKMYLSPIAAWAKWYFVKGNYKDGIVGITLASYAMRYTFLKYKIARSKSISG